MKRVIFFFLVFAIVSIRVFAGINTSWDRFSKPHGNLKCNVNIGNEIDPNYYPVQLKLDVPVGTSDEFGKRQITIYWESGTNQTEAFDFTTKQGQKDYYNACPPWFQTMLKEAVQTGTGEDISQ